MRWRRVLLGILAVCAPPVLAAGEETIRFAPAEAVSGWVVHIQTETGSKSASVSDARLVFDGWEDNPEAVLNAPDVVVADPFRWVFGLAITVVADGQIFDEGYALCSPWAKDRAICSIECDGGHFRLDRRPGPDGLHLVMVLTALPDLIKGDKTGAIRIGECGEGGEVLLDTVTGKTGALVFR